MNWKMIYDSIMRTAVGLIGVPIDYLAGKNFLTIVEVTDDLIRADRLTGSVTIPLSAVNILAKSLETGIPVHVDTVFNGRGSYRSALEAIVARSPYCGFLPANSKNNVGAKKIIWFDYGIHDDGQVYDATDLVLTRSEVAGPAACLFPNSAISRALLSKPFLILTGPSGTGKSLGAIRLAEGICGPECRELVAVGADWTDNRHVLGFLNPLQTIREQTNGQDVETPLYESTPILNLLLHANQNPDKPHVLILDEMNLSHVERYFADFLSGMELQDKGHALKLHSAKRAVTRGGQVVAGSIDFPENLFVIGTVNIDETTYMFSPKVLDRANVIEIHADEDALKDFLLGELEMEDEVLEDHGIPFLELAQVIRREEEHELVPALPLPVRQAAAKHLMELFRIMRRGRGEFGFRTGREVLAYLRASYALTPETGRHAWVEADLDAVKSVLDILVLQKVLPKLHGSRTRIAPLLGALATYCATGKESMALEHFCIGPQASKRSLSESRGIANPWFPQSYTKLERMIDVLVEEQFVSFIC